MSISNSQKSRNAVLPHMRQQKSVRIINVRSVVGKFCYRVNGAYSASRCAPEALSDAMRLELAGFGIPVVLIEPGAISTNFMSTYACTAASAMTLQVRL